jgi:hypothetical protein
VNWFVRWEYDSICHATVPPTTARTSVAYMGARLRVQFPTQHNGHSVHGFARCGVICEELIHQRAAPSFAKCRSAAHVPMAGSTGREVLMVLHGERVRAFTFGRKVTTILPHGQGKPAINTTVMRRILVLCSNQVAFYTGISRTLPPHSVGDELPLPSFHSLYADAAACKYCWLSG